MRLLRVAASLVLLAPSLLFACTSSTSAPTCEDRTTKAENQVQAAAASQSNAGLTCATDSDCTLASNSNVCWNGCGVALNQTAAPKLQAAIMEINATTCASFVADGCNPNPAPPCAALGAYCVAGQCEELGGPPARDAGIAARDGASDSASE